MQPIEIFLELAAWTLLTVYLPCLILANIFIFALLGSILVMEDTVPDSVPAYSPKIPSTSANLSLTLSSGMESIFRQPREELEASAQRQKERQKAQDMILAVSVILLVIVLIIVFYLGLAWFRLYQRKKLAANQIRIDLERDADQIPLDHMGIN